MAQVDGRAAAELEGMLAAGVKVELESLHATPGGLEVYIKAKLEEWQISQNAAQDMADVVESGAAVEVSADSQRTEDSQQHHRIAAMDTEPMSQQADGSAQTQPMSQLQDSMRLDEFAGSDAMPTSDESAESARCSQDAGSGPQEPQEPQEGGFENEFEDDDDATCSEGEHSFEEESADESS